MTCDGTKVASQDILRLQHETNIGSHKYKSPRESEKPNTLLVRGTRVNAQTAVYLHASRVIA